MRSGGSNSDFWRFCEWTQKSLGQQTCWGAAALPRDGRITEGTRHEMQKNWTPLRNVMLSAKMGTWRAEVNKESKRSFTSALSCRSHSPTRGWCGYAFILGVFCRNVDGCCFSQVALQESRAQLRVSLYPCQASAWCSTAHCFHMFFLQTVGCPPQIPFRREMCSALFQISCSRLPSHSSELARQQQLQSSQEMLQRKSEQAVTRKIV